MEDIPKMLVGFTYHLELKLETLYFANPTILKPYPTLVNGDECPKVFFFLFKNHIKIKSMIRRMVFSSRISHISKCLHQEKPLIKWRFGKILGF